MSEKPFSYTTRFDACPLAPAGQDELEPEASALAAQPAEPDTPRGEPPKRTGLYAGVAGALGGAAAALGLKAASKKGEQEPVVEKESELPDEAEEQGVGGNEPGVAEPVPKPSVGAEEGLLPVAAGEQQGGEGEKELEAGGQPEPEALAPSTGLTTRDFPEEEVHALSPFEGSFPRPS